MRLPTPSGQLVRKDKNSPVSITPTMGYRFSGHETFVFRYGWLEKGVNAVAASATAFSDEDAMVKLGVGKNMVESIRHWCLVTRLIEEDSTTRQKGGRRINVSPIGSKLLLPRGWDPFMEDDASLWLVHWLLVSNTKIGTTWQVMFTQFQRPDFTRRELADYMMTFAERHSVRTRRKSMERDVDCFLRSYVSARGKSKQAVLEETFDCPLQELNLIQQTPDSDVHRFVIGPKPSLPAPVFAFALLEYFERVRGESNAINLDDCLYGQGSPGQAFKLDENSLIDYVEQIGKSTRGGLAVDDTAGMKQIFRKHAFDPFHMLDQYYGSEVRR